MADVCNIYAKNYSREENILYLLAILDGELTTQQKTLNMSTVTKHYLKSGTFPFADHSKVLRIVTCGR